MGSYVELNLTEDEKVQYEGKISLWSLLPKILLGLIGLLVMVWTSWPWWIGGIGLLFGVSATITYYTTELAITNKRVIAKFGFIRRNTVEINISKIESIQIDQGIRGRIFNFGSIIVSGAGNPVAPIPGISSPLEFRKMFFKVQEGGSATS